MSNETHTIGHECDCGKNVTVLVTYMADGRVTENNTRCRKCRAVWRINTWISHKGRYVADWRRTK